MPNAARIGYELTEICDDSRDFLSPLTTVIKKAHPCLGGGGGGGQFQNERSSFVSCRFDPATWESKTATYIARRKQLR